MSAHKHENRYHNNPIVLLIRKSGNVIGWVLISVGVFLALSIFALFLALLSSIGWWVWAGVAGVCFGVYQKTETDHLRKQLRNRDRWDAE